VVLPSSLESPDVWGDEILMRQFAARVVLDIFGA
jgi:hypothetical protein